VHEKTTTQPYFGVQGQGGPRSGEKRADLGAELAQKFDVHATQIAAWKAELLKGAVNVFDDGKPTAEEKVDINRLHAKIGQLTLENDFLESALTKAGLLSARK
jgi:transposase